jgi:thiol-disulfide isomerase/thioredoxin
MKKYILSTIIFSIVFTLCTQSAQAQANVGNVAPDFTLKALDGKEVTLSKLKGKYVLIDFWGSWCMPCRRMSPQMVELYAKLKGKQANIEFISVACNERNDEIWKNAITDDKLTWTQLNDAHSTYKSIAAQYAIRGVPTCILVSTDGKILYREHPVTLIEKVEKLFEITK